MFSNHIGKDLSAYCHGELSPAASQGVAEHLIGCQRCRVEFEQIKLGVKFAEQLPQLSAPNSLWNEVQGLINSREVSARAVSIEKSSWASLFQPQFAAIAATLLLAAGLGGYWFYARESRPFWQVARLNGAPRIGATVMNEKGRLAIGEWLETDGASRAKIDVGTIGQVEIDPNTRVRLLQTGATEHRLELAQGKMSAHIWAPPRLFFVDTPSAVAADLGCAYTLEVNKEGGSLLRVTSGWVALQLKNRESMVPAGAACETRSGIGPGTPYFEDASEPARLALAEFDFKPDDASGSKTRALEVVLREARPRDTLTLWHMLSRVEGKDRARVCDRMIELAPPPYGVTRDGVLQLNEQMLQLWKDSLETVWRDNLPSPTKKTLTRIWTSGLGRIRGLQGKR
ncbi:MAG: FecR domain-containing protein [Pyrinomonadaceae bacterium]